MGVANRGFHKEVSAARMLFRMWEAALLKKGASPKPLSSQNGKRGEFRALRSTARGSSPLDSRKLLKKFDQNFCLGIAGYEYKNRNLSTPPFSGVYQNTDPVQAHRRDAFRFIRSRTPPVLARRGVLCYNRFRLFCGAAAAHRPRRVQSR